LYVRFHDAGKLLLPYLERFWQYVLETPCPVLPSRDRESLVEASLAASRLVGVARAGHAIAVAAKISTADLPTHLQLAMVARQSVMLRLKGDHEQSDILIQAVLKSTPIIGIRSHCLLGSLLLSRTENAILRKDFDQAASYLRQWQVKSDQPSQCELQTVRLKNTVFGRVSRYQGDFQHARECLELCLKLTLTETSRYHVMHHLADVYCELELPAKAEELLQVSIEDLKNLSKQRSKAFRRLLLPFAEARIQQQRFEEAGAAFSQLNDIFDEIVDHNVTDQLDHVRSMLGLMRIAYHKSRWSEALESSEKAFLLMQKYKTFSNGNFYIGITLLSRAVISFELGQLQESRKALASAKFYDQGPRYFIPGIGTYVLRPLKLRTESLHHLLINQSPV